MADPALKRLRQIAKPSNPNDQLDGPAVAGIQASATDLADFFDGILSQLKRVIHGPDIGSWNDNLETVFGPSTASLKAIMSGMAAITPDQIRSDPGRYAVASGVLVRDLVYASGDYQAARADNGNITTAPVLGMVVDKPSSVTATVAYAGKVDGFVGLTPGTVMFLGTNGAIIAASAGLPTAVDSVIQQVGIAVSPSEFILAPRIPVRM